MSTIKANTLLHSDGSTTNPPAIPALDKRMAKAWITFTGTGTIAINDSYNISSLTDNSTGIYTFSFTTAMANANYSTLVTNDNGATTASTRGVPSASSQQVSGYYNHNNTYFDDARITAVVFSS